MATAPTGDLSQWGADRRKAGDAGDGGRERRRRRLAGVPDRCQRQSHRGERIDGRAESAPALLAAVAVVAILLFLTGPVAHLPKAVLGAVIVSAAVGLVDVEAWRKLAAADRVEVAIAAVTAAGVVVVGVLEAVVFAVGLTILDAVRRSARPGDAVLGYDAALGRFVDVAQRPDARVVPDVVVYRLDDRLFFANAR